MKDMLWGIKLMFFILLLGISEGLDKLFINRKNKVNDN